jgi:hypothetical protein
MPKGTVGEQVKAAEAVLDQAVKGVETQDLLERVEELERRAKREKQA